MTRSLAVRNHDPVSGLPCAAEGLTSYRYRGRYGWIMIGASSLEEALQEAARSSTTAVTPDRLEVWTTGGYVPVMEGQ